MAYHLISRPLQLMTEPIDKIAYERHAKIGRLITKVNGEVTDALDQALAPFDISAAQYVVVSLLMRKQAETATELCKELSYNPGAMTRMLDRLERKHLIGRTRLPEDRRTVRLEVTAQGKEVYPTLFALSAAVIERFYGGFSVNELNQMESLLNRVLRRAETGSE